MGDIRNSLQIEDRALEILIPYARGVSINGQIVTTGKGKNAKVIQARLGDILINTKGGDFHTWGDLIGIEVKAELRNSTGNFFLENWSNCKRGRENLGWMHKLECDYLWYYFLESDELYSIHFDSLWKWFFEENNNRKYAQKTQSKYNQLNITKGVCVKISDIEDFDWIKKKQPVKEMSKEKNVA